MPTPGSLRPVANRERDENHKPKETLTFFRLQDDFKVVELVPGGGWYTRILAPVLQEKGQLDVALGTKRFEANLLGTPGFEAVKVPPVVTNARPEGRRTTVGPLDFGVRGVDMVLTFRNLHNFADEGRANLNAAVFAALKPGGHYGVVDHTRRHMAEDTYETWRRMDPVQMIKEIETRATRTDAPCCSAIRSSRVVRRDARSTAPAASVSACPVPTRSSAE